MGRLPYFPYKWRISALYSLWNPIGTSKYPYVVAHVPAIPKDSTASDDHKVIPTNHAACGSKDPPLRTMFKFALMIMICSGDEIDCPDPHPDCDTGQRRTAQLRYPDRARYDCAYDVLDPFPFIVGRIVWCGVREQ
jgi:hypothetical protein